MPPPVLYVHLSVEGGVFVVRTDGTEAWITAADLEEDLERLAERDGTVLISIEGGRDAQPQVHALHRRVIGTGLPTRVLEDRHPAVTPLPEGVTRLMSFAHAGRVDLLSDVLARGAVADVRDQQGTTPLMYAANRGERDAVLALLDHGAAPDAADTTARPRSCTRPGAGMWRWCGRWSRRAPTRRPPRRTAGPRSEIAADEGHDEVVAVLRELDPGNMG